MLTVDMEIQIKVYYLFTYRGIYVFLQFFMIDYDELS